MERGGKKGRCSVVSFGRPGNPRFRWSTELNLGRSEVL